MISEDIILAVQNLEKYYGNQKVIDNISFEIRKGECFGLLGPNGAGKSTTIEIIEQIIPSDAGEVLYRGAKPDAGFLERLGAMTDPVFLVESHLGEGLDLAVRDEYRVVPKSVPTAFFLGNRSVANPFDHLYVAVGRGDRHHAAKPGGTFVERHGFHVLEKFLVVLVVGTGLAGVAG